MGDNKCVTVGVVAVLEFDELWVVEGDHVWG